MKKIKKQFGKNKKEKSLLTRFNLNLKNPPILITFLAGAMSIFIVLAIVFASQATIMGLQGKATDSSGNPVDNGDLEVNISSANDCYGDIYSEEYIDTIQGGLFNVTLGLDTNLFLDYNQDYYMCLNIDNGTAVGPSVFRGGQGQVSEEDLDIDSLNITGNLNVTGNITVSSNINITGNVTSAGEITGSYVSLVREKGKTIGRAGGNGNLDYFYGTNIASSTTVWFVVNGTNGNGDGSETNPIQLGEVLVPVGSQTTKGAKQLYIRLITLCTSDNPNCLISLMHPNASYLGLGMSASTGAFTNGIVDVNKTGFFKAMINVPATFEVDYWGLTVLGYVSEPE